MIPLQGMKSLWKTFLISLLLMCLSIHSGLAFIEQGVSGNAVFDAPTFWGDYLISMGLSGSERVTVEFNNMHCDAAVLVFHFSTLYSSSYPPITLSITDYVSDDSSMSFYYQVAPHSMINLTRGTVSGVPNDNMRNFYFMFSAELSTNSALYVVDFTGTFSAQKRGNAFWFGVFNCRLVDPTVDRNRTGVYLSRMAANNARSLFVRSVVILALQDETSGLQHFDTISVTDSVCNDCNSSFYRDETTNVIENGLVRLQNCIHNSATPFFQQVKTDFGEEYLQLLDNANLILSNVTTNGPLFGYTPNGDSTISSTARMTLHNITAQSLYPATTSAPLFSTVPDGAQVYAGPVTLDGRTYNTLADYQSLKLPFTRVIDVGRKTLFVAPGRPNAKEVMESSNVGSFSASHCVNDGYSSVGLGLIPVTKTREALCVCNADRFAPHCSTTWDPLGISLCPINQALSSTTNQCVSCVLDYCRHCDEANKCALCDDGYMVSGTNCIQKTCTKPPCDACDSPSGNTDTCKSCSFPFAVNPLSQQCDACIDNYKLVGTDCIQKNCAKPPSKGCNSASGNEDISVGCTSPHQLNPSTQQCDACIDNYKMGDDDVCIEKTCAKPPSMGCNPVSGNEDISVGCASPHILNSSTQQCDACEPGLKYVQSNTTCVKKQCLVENCANCVFDEEYQCDSCVEGSVMDDDFQCGAVSENKKVSTGMLVGIIVAIVVVVLLVVFLLVFFLYCRRQRRSYEAVEHVEMEDKAAVKGNNLPSVEVEEETEVTIIKPEGEGDERNPLLPTEEANEPPTVSGGRRTRRARNVRRTQAEIADVDLDAMYSKDNEIQEDIF